MILIVEDDRFILEGLILSLKDEGFELVSASSYQEACTVIEEKLNRLEMVLLDVTLPDGSGFDLFHLLGIDKHAHDAGGMFRDKKT